MRRNQKSEPPGVEKSLILSNRAAHVRAELIQPEGRQLRGIEWRAGVELVISQKLEQAPMKLVGPGFRGIDEIED